MHSDWKMSSDGGHAAVDECAMSECVSICSACVFGERWMCSELERGMSMQPVGVIVLRVVDAMFMAFRHVPIATTSRGNSQMNV